MLKLSVVIVIVTIMIIFGLFYNDHCSAKVSDKDVVFLSSETASEFYGGQCGHFDCTNYSECFDFLTWQSYGFYTCVDVIYQADCEENIRICWTPVVIPPGIGILVPMFHGCAGPWPL